VDKSKLGVMGDTYGVVIGVMDGTFWYRIGVMGDTLTRSFRFI